MKSNFKDMSLSEPGGLAPQPQIIVSGAGHLGSYHLQKIALSTEARLVGVIDTDPAKLARASADFKIGSSASLPEFLRVYKERLGYRPQQPLKNPLGVIIATPTFTHFSLVKEALEYGLDVLVEKPLTLTSAEALTLVELAKERGLILQVGHCERFNPAVTSALKLIKEPLYIVSERLTPFSGRSTDIDVLLDLMIHDLDILLALGLSEVQEVRAIGVPIFTNSLDMAAVRLVFKNGVVAQLSAGRASLEATRKLRVFTKERYISIDCLTKEVKSVKRVEQVTSKPLAAAIVKEEVEISAIDALNAQDHDFIRCMLSRKTPLVSGEVGLATLRLVELIKAELSK